MAITNLLGEDSCNPQKRKERVLKIFKDFRADVTDTIQDIANQSYGPFLATFVLLVQQLATTQVFNLISFAASAIVGNIVGTMYSLVGMALASFNGFSIMLKYLAVKTLNSGLKTRIAFTTELLKEITGMIRLLTTLGQIRVTSNTLFKRDIEQALTHIKNASRLVGLEVSKMENSSRFEVSREGNVINELRLLNATYEIEKAITRISGVDSSSPALSGALTRLSEKYGFISIDKNKVSVDNPINLGEYFKSIKDQIYQQYSIEDGTLNERGERVLLSFLMDFLSQGEVSEYFREVTASFFLKDRIDTLGLRLPVSLISGKLAAGDVINQVLNKFSSDDGALQEAIAAVDSGRNAVTDAFNGYFDELTFLQDSAPRGQFSSDFTNLSIVSAAVETAQFVIASQEALIANVKARASVVKLFLRPASTLLKNTEKDVTSFIKEDADFNFKNILNKRTKWSFDLTKAKTLLESGTPRDIVINGETVSFGRIDRLFRAALETYIDLQDKIVNETLDENGDPITSLRVKAQEIGEDRLSSLALGSISALNPGVRTSVIEGLQSIRILLSEQNTTDNNKLGLTERFIQQVESVPIFGSQIKPAWDKMIESLNGNLAIRTIKNELATGNIATLSKGLSSATSYVSTQVDYLRRCKGLEGLTDNDISKVIGDAGEVSQKTRREAVASVNRLKNKLQLLEVLKEGEV